MVYGMNRKYYQIQLPNDLESPLKAIALDLGDLYKGSPSPTRVITRIAQRDYAVVPVAATEQQRQVTQENLAKLQPLLVVRQAFKILYRDSQGVVKNLVCRYGQISFWERRHYLDVWANESDDSGVAALRHNHCLRIDRILEVQPADEEWRSRGLDTIEVRLQLINGLVKAYERKPQDVALELAGDRLVVTRLVSNVFWFCRETLRYGRDAVVLSPDELRRWMRDEVISMASNYDEDFS